MKPHPRIRKTIKWGGAAAVALLLAMWAVSERWSVNRETLNWTLSLYRSSFVVVRHEGPDFRAPPGWYAVRHDASPAIRSWWFEAWDTSGATMMSRFNLVLVPLWIPASAALLGTLAAWRLDARARRRAGAGRCPKCSYDLAGLAPRAACPECGVASTRP